MTSRGKSDDDIHLTILLEEVHRRYGFDFRDYARSSLRRRVVNAMRAEKLAEIDELRERIVRDPAAMERLLLALTVNVTSMFRDPEMYLGFRRHVVPMLRSYPFTRIWHAGCSTGEEVYSMAILMHEEGLYDRCRIYATDMNEMALRRATEAVYPLGVLEANAEDYKLAGGTASLTDYHSSSYGYAIINHSLRRNVVFAHHNLATDGSFNEFHVIFCRNVMIYFNRRLQDRVHRLMFDSLRRFGTLALGLKESLVATPHERDYDVLDARLKLYRRRA
jgi:chemotaxis protein methyltransferase CheR